MTYHEALRYLESFTNYELIDGYRYSQSVKLDRMKRLAHLTGNPHRSFKSIHIAGTKGKGSTAAITYSILKESGFRVGLYTSPHLVSMRERIRVDGKLIEEDSLIRSAERLAQITDRLGDDQKPTFFEVYTALAFLYFQEKAVDFAILETGLGGRLDATNVVTPLVCAITPISYEHTNLLGEMLSAIAYEKAGIIKEGTLCISASQEPDVAQIIDRCASAKNAELLTVGKDIAYRVVSRSDQCQVIDVQGRYDCYSRCRLPLIGDHQAENAAVAVGITESLRSFDITVNRDAIVRGIEKTEWSGRIEILRRDPLIVVDGAQNAASARTLSAAVKNVFRYARLLLVLGVSKDKDVKGICGHLLPASDVIVLTKSSVRQRALDPSVIKREVTDKRDVVSTENVKDALIEAMKRARREDLILITGSLYVVGDAKALLTSSRVIS